MVSALQGNGSFEYMGKGFGEGGYYFGIWGTPTRKVLCHLGKRAHMTCGESVEIMRGVDAGGGRG